MCVVLGVAALNVWLVQRSRTRVFSVAAEVPECGAAVVPGTSRLAPSGRINVHWAGRMDAAAELYRSGRVKHILVSGDNRKHNYNEPVDMRKGLLERGVPAEAITLDFAGLRTLDTIVRAQRIFGVKQCVIVSDDFHLPRALWLADRHGLNAVGYCGPAVPWRLSAKSRVREWLARVRAAGDEWILHTQPRHLGDPEPIPGI